MSSHLCLTVPLLMAVAKDSNASALDAGMQVLLTFFSHVPRAKESAKDLVVLVIKHGFAGRPATAEKAREAVLKAMELAETQHRARVG